jgi:hypothetical protein
MAVKAKAPDQPVPVQSPPPNVSATNPAAKPAPKPTPAPAVTSHDPRTAVIDKARAMLDEGQVQEAHKLLTRQKGNDPAIKNALGVCLMRMGSLQPALSLLRSLVIASNGVTLSNSAPKSFKINYATALLLNGQITGCAEVLAEIHDDADPAVQQLRGEIRKWKQSLTIWQRLRWVWGDEIDKPIILDSPAGII